MHQFNSSSHNLIQTSSISLAIIHEVEADHYRTPENTYTSLLDEFHLLRPVKSSRNEHFNPDEQKHVALFLDELFGKYDLDLSDNIEPVNPIPHGSNGIYPTWNGLSKDKFSATLKHSGEWKSHPGDASHGGEHQPDGSFSPKKGEKDANLSPSSKTGYSWIGDTPHTSDKMHSQSPSSWSSVVAHHLSLPNEKPSTSPKSSRSPSGSNDYQNLPTPNFSGSFEEVLAWKTPAAEHAPMDQLDDNPEALRPILGYSDWVDKEGFSSMSRGDIIASASSPASAHNRDHLLQDDMPHGNFPGLLSSSDWLGGPSLPPHVSNRDRPPALSNELQGNNPVDTKPHIVSDTLTRSNQKKRTRNSFSQHGTFDRLSSSRHRLDEHPQEQKLSRFTYVVEPSSGAMHQEKLLKPAEASVFSHVQGVGHSHDPSSKSVKHSLSTPSPIKKLTFSGEDSPVMATHNIRAESRGDDDDYLLNNGFGFVGWLESILQSDGDFEPESRSSDSRSEITISEGPTLPTERISPSRPINKDINEDLDSLTVKSTGPKENRKAKLRKSRNFQSQLDLEYSTLTPPFETNAAIKTKKILVGPDGVLSRLSVNGEVPGEHIPDLLPSDSIFLYEAPEFVCHNHEGGPQGLPPQLQIYPPHVKELLQNTLDFGLAPRFKKPQFMSIIRGRVERSIYNFLYMQLLIHRHFETLGHREQNLDHILSNGWKWMSRFWPNVNLARLAGTCIYKKFSIGDLTLPLDSVAQIYLQNQMAKRLQAKFAAIMLLEWMKESQQSWLDRLIDKERNRRDPSQSLIRLLNPMSGGWLSPWNVHRTRKTSPNISGAVAE